MKTVCSENQCTGCMTCVENCPKEAIKIKDSWNSFNAVIDEDTCIKCGKCYKTCQNNSKIELCKPIEWLQGWTKDEKIRERAASGGVATAVISAFIKQDGFVCSCVFEEGKFVYKLVNNGNDIEKFAGSKYVKSNPYGVYKQIREKLANGKKVLFVGLPCHVAAIKKYVESDLQDDLYTIDLICHGTPSPEFLRIFLKENGYNLNEIDEIKFRKKMAFKLFDKDYTPIITSGMPDRYLFSFLKGLNYTENCYSCKFASEKRVSDITLGDSWGNTLSPQEKGKGISLIICQTEKGKALLEHANLHLEYVDKENAIKNNKQLNAPAKKIVERVKFMNYIHQGKSYDYAVFRCYPKIFIRQYIKCFLNKLGFFKGGGRSFVKYSLYVRSKTEK